MRHPFYFLQKCIQSCRSLEHIEACERMINQVHALYAKELATMALLKKVELLTTRYTNE